MLIKVGSKETEAVVAALSRKLPATLKRSLTWDRGLEMAKHKDFTVATKGQVYFCDPQSPWQRGTNESTNLLLRQYFPRGTDLSGYSQAQLKRREDIPLLVEYFIDRYARKAGKHFKSVEKRTHQVLQSYTWPGNIRELQNVIERSVIVCETASLSVDESWLSHQPPENN